MLSGRTGNKAPGLGAQHFSPAPGTVPTFLPASPEQFSTGRARQLPPRMLATKSPPARPWKWSSQPPPRQALLFGKSSAPPPTPHCWLLLLPMALITGESGAGGRGCPVSRNITSACSVRSTS